MKWTIWQRYDKKKNTYTHNHSEAGWVDGASPKKKKPEFLNQEKSWSGGDGWRKIHGYKINGSLLEMEI